MPEVKICAKSMSLTNTARFHIMIYVFEAMTADVLSKIDCVRWCGAYVGRNVNKEFLYNTNTYRLYTARMDDYTSPLYRLSDYGWPDNNWTRGGS